MCFLSHQKYTSISNTFRWCNFTSLEDGIISTWSLDCSVILRNGRKRVYKTPEKMVRPIVAVKNNRLLLSKTRTFYGRRGLENMQKVNRLSALSSLKVGRVSDNKIEVKVNKARQLLTKKPTFGTLTLCKLIDWLRMLGRMWFGDIFDYLARSLSIVVVFYCKLECLNK